MEMKKPQARRMAKGSEFLFSLNEPWDTLLAQVLCKVSAALNPEVINIDNYEISYFIPHVLPKPGLSLMNLNDFDGLLKRAKNMTGKDPTINLIIVEREQARPKNMIQNDEEVGIATATKTAKKRVIFLQFLMISCC